MKPFREMNPIPIALIGIATLVLLMFAAFNAQNLPIIGSGSTYYADFSDASGLMPQNDVRVAGIKVGQVTSIKLVGAVVRVAFKIKGVQLGDQTTAAIKIKTLLGQKFVALDPEGTGNLAGGSVIPLARTSTPFDVTTAFIGLSKRIENIDTASLTKAFNTLADTFQFTPPHTRAALEGLARFSETIATRDVQLQQLLGHARAVTAVLASRDAVVTKLINDGDVVLQLVEQQRAVIHDLLVNSSNLAIQLAGLVQDNRAVIGPALSNLQNVTTILSRNQANLDRSIHLLAPFVRDFNNTLGNGRWFDTFVADLPIPPGSTVQLPGGSS